MARSTDDYATPNWKKGKVKSDRPNQPQTPALNAPKWSRTKKRMDNEPANEPTRYDPAGAGGYDPTKIQAPAWLNNAAVWLRNNINASQYVPAGLSQAQRPTTMSQFNLPKTARSMPTGTFFAGGNTVRTGEASGMRLGAEPLNPPAGEGYHWEGNVRVKDTTGLTMNPLNYRPRWSNGLAPAGEAGRPFQPSVTGFNFTPSNTGGGSGGGYGSGYGYGSGGGGGGGYSYPSSERVPAWLLNLYNWNYKG